MTDWAADRDAAYLRWMADNDGQKTNAERMAFMEGFACAAFEYVEGDDE